MIRRKESIKEGVKKSRELPENMQKRFCGMFDRLHGGNGLHTGIWHGSGVIPLPGEHRSGNDNLTRKEKIDGKRT